MESQQPANPVRGYEPNAVIARGRFAGAIATAPTLLEAFNIKSVVQSSTTSGLFTVTLNDKILDFIPKVEPVAAHADFHQCPVFNVDLEAGTFQFAHYIQAARSGTHSPTNGASPAVMFHIFAYGRSTL